MIFLEPVRDGLLDMWAYKGRTILQTLGIMLGSASVIVTIALLAGGKEENRAYMETTGGVTTLEVRKAEGGRQPITARNKGPFGVTLLDVDAIRGAVEPLGARVNGVRRLESDMRYRDAHQDVLLWGVDPENAQMEHLAVARGRYISAADVEASAPVVVLGSWVAQKLFGDEDPLGKIITYGHAGERAPRRYLVVGLLDTKWYSSKGDTENYIAWMNHVAYIPITAAVHRESGGNEVDGVTVHAPSLEAVLPVKLAMDQALLRRHRGVRNYTIFDRSDRLKEWNSNGAMYDAAIGGAGGISLLVGGIVVMNILLASLSQRIREVGIRKALGARNTEIFVQFLTESVIVAGMGGIGGAVLGSSVSDLVSRMIKQELLLSPQVILMGVGISVTVGLIFGIYPALRASRLDPVVALHYE